MTRLLKVLQMFLSPVFHTTKIGCSSKNIEINTIDRKEVDMLDELGICEVMCRYTHLKRHL
jgi:hypothetical protein